MVLRTIDPSLADTLLDIDKYLHPGNLCATKHQARARHDL